MRVLCGARAYDVFEQQGVHDFFEGFGATQDLFTLSLRKLRLCFLEKVFYDIRDIVSVIAHLGVLGSLNVDEGCIVDLRDLPKYFCLARA